MCLEQRNLIRPDPIKLWIFYEVDASRHVTHCHTILYGETGYEGRGAFLKLDGSILDEEHLNKSVRAESTIFLDTDNPYLLLIQLSPRDSRRESRENFPH